MAIVVTGIVDDLGMREADEADDEKAEQRRRRQAGRRAKPRRWRGERRSSGIHQIVLSPSTRGHLVDFRRRQVSWLAE